MSRLSPLGLSELDAVRLQNRVDTKYLLRTHELEAWLRGIEGHYSCLELDGVRAFGYFTRYFDTHDRDMYRAHHDGRRSRFKVRKRLYLESGDSFLEVKEKTNRGRTRKSRVLLSGGGEHDSLASLDERDGIFVARHTPYGPTPLIHTLSNRFERVTLADRWLTERVTIDGSISWSLPPSQGGTETEKPPPSEFFIVEVKRSKSTARSLALQVLEQRRVQPASFSKYCMGAAYLDQTLKRNLFKAALRTMMT